MPTKPEARFTIKMDGTDRGLFSVGVTKHGDVMLRLKTAAIGRAIGTTISKDSDDERHRQRVKETRVSIHPSRKSEGTNTIKMTCLMENGSKEEIYNVTAALKKDGLFAPVFASRQSNMRTHEFNVKDDDRNVSLGSMSRHFTLVFQVFVGPAERVFRQSATCPCNVMQRVFGEFRVVILWAFLGIAPDDSSAQSYIGTIPDVTGEGRGFRERQCLALFRDIQNLLKDEMLQTVSTLVPNSHQTAALAVMLTQAKFVKRASLDSPEMQQWFEKMRRATAGMGRVFPDIPI